MNKEGKTNRLINESSPYLLQHAHNPVDWYPWCKEAFERAKSENKLVIISIGYSACHWCHVMERECFEDAEAAGIMNENFVCIKVDREERPDIDMLYMDAINVLSGRGGWPLNCFTLANGKPIYGGTYFPKQNWVQVLTNLNKLYREDPEKLSKLSEEIEKGILSISLLPEVQNDKGGKDFKYAEEFTNQMVSAFDLTFGGYNYTPKFPMPNNYEYLLYYTYILKNMGRAADAKVIADHVYNTLDKMAMGGICDQIGGGFARYSTDSFWKVPHFEKMLYDNAQLMSLYSNAYKTHPKDMYKEVVYGIYKFVSDKMMSAEGAFYCSMDADSEGKEGEYYVWKEGELKELLGGDFPLFASYYNINSKNVWEFGKYILQRKKQDVEFCSEKNISMHELFAKKQKWIAVLYERREQRVAPMLDDKALASWNGLMLKGLVDAYNTFRDPMFLNAAIRSADFIKTNLITDEGALWHGYKKDKCYIKGFLDDYAFVASAYIALYETTFNEKWLNMAKGLADYAIANFYDGRKSVFYYTHREEDVLITRKAEVMDNVIPASNSEMALVVYKLGHLFVEKKYLDIADEMMTVMRGSMMNYAQNYTNWGILMLHNEVRFCEVAITGKLAHTFRDKINKEYLPNKILLGAESASGLEMLKGRFIAHRTLVFVCENKTCLLPFSSVGEAIKGIKEVR